MLTLYHYTCTHSHRAINGHLRPGVDGLVWLTDLDVPIVAALGLTSTILDCDRTEHRYRVLDPSAAAPFLEYLAKMPRFDRALLGQLPGMPRHWWVVPGPVPVVYDPISAPR